MSGWTFLVDAPWTFLSNRPIDSPTDRDRQMKVQIKNRWNGAVLYECDVPETFLLGMAVADGRGVAQEVSE